MVVESSCELILASLLSVSLKDEIEETCSVVAASMDVLVFNSFSDKSSNWELMVESFVEVSFRSIVEVACWDEVASRKDPVLVRLVVRFSSAEITLDDIRLVRLDAMDFAASSSRR